MCGWISIPQFERIKCPLARPSPNPESLSQLPIKLPKIKNEELDVKVDVTS